MALYNYIVSTGVIVPDTSELLGDVQTEFLNTFGEDLILNPETPQGVLITSETLARSAVVENNALLANQINPNLAVGVFQDAICALTGLERTANTFSTVVANVTGVPGTMITKVAIAALTTGEQFSPLTTITLDDSGNGSGIFQALVAGPIAIPAGTLTVIVASAIGWETITNPTSGTLGTLEQSDQSLQRQRALSLALQGVSLPEAIMSRLTASTIGLTSFTFLENYTNETQVISGVTLVAHSIYVNATNDSPLSYTQIVGQLTGTPGTVVPAGSIVADTSSVQYSLLEEVILDSGGTGTGLFQSVDPGIYSTAIGDLTTIVSDVSGWDDIDNVQPSTVYSQEFLLGVATVLLESKSAGCDYNGGPGDPPYGAYTIDVLEPVSGQLYAVTFGTPTPVPISIQITVTLTPSFVGDAISLVQNAILAYAETTLNIGTTVSAFDISTAVSTALPGLNVNLVETTITEDVDFTTNPIPIDMWEQATVTQGAISVSLTNANLLFKRA